MDEAPDLFDYAHAVGQAAAAWRFASGELRRAAALAAVSAAWSIYLRDAGAGDVGPAHETEAADGQLLLSGDPRRDAVLLWLADYGAPPIAEAAATIAGMVGAARRFSADDRALLDAARDALAHPASTLGSSGKRIAAASQSENAALDSLRAMTASVDRLRCNADFLEGEGSEVSHLLPGGTLRRYVPAKPAGCWALNLALMSQSVQPVGAMSPPGMVSRRLFRADLEPGEIAAQLVDDAGGAWRSAYGRILRMEQELTRGGGALSSLSRNARARDAWLLVAALSTCTRAQLARALGLSRAGADIQAHALADAGLATLAVGGVVAWTRPREAQPALKTLDHGPLANAVSDLDASLAEIDRLVARAAAKAW